MFTEKLQTIVSSTQGGEAAILMGNDGIPVDHFENDEQLDIETVGMEFSVLLKEVRRTAEMLETGATDEMIITTDQSTTILRVVSSDYFLAMVLRPGGNVGRARYALRMLAPQLQSELI